MKSYQTSRRRLRTGVHLDPRWAARMLTVFWVALACFPPSIEAAEADSAKTAPAKATVVAFLDAVKRGDDAAARGMLTKVARAKTEELGMSVAPPVADTATYSVRDCELISDSGDLAHVATIWTDVDPDGTKTSEDVIWVVRLDPEGWRVVGMAMRVFDDMPPLLLNFEDPDDMLAKQELVAAELQKRFEMAEKAAATKGTAGGAEQPRTALGSGAGQSKVE